MNLQDYLPFFTALSLQGQDALNSFAVNKTFKKGYRFHSGSSDCLGLMAMTGGQLRAFIISESGRELTLYRLTDGEVCLFTASCILKNANFDIFIETEKDSSCILIPSGALESVIKEPPAQEFINALMAKRLSDVLWLIENAFFKSLDSRIAAFLVEQSALENSHALSITHGEIAKHIGSAREAVSRMLKHFQSENLIKVERGQIVIADINGLITLANA